MVRLFFSATGENFGVFDSLISISVKEIRRFVKDFLENFRLRRFFTYKSKLPLSLLKFPLSLLNVSDTPPPPQGGYSLLGESRISRLKTSTTDN